MSDTTGNQDIEFDRDRFYDDLGRRMKLLRERADYTQEQVAKKVGIPRSTYANMERGRQRTPADIVWRLSIVLGVSVTDLLPEPVGRTLTVDAFDVDPDSTVTLPEPMEYCSLCGGYHSPNSTACFSGLHTTSSSGIGSFA